MAKKALIIFADGFEEMEAIAPADILRRAGIEVTIAGLKSTTVKGSRGIVVLCDKKLDEINEDFDALILPGGSTGARNLHLSETVKRLIECMNKSNKLIAAICASPAIVLSPMGILNNKFATCYPGMENLFQKGVKFKEGGVVSDGNIITGRGAGSSIEFALKIVEKICGIEIKDKVKKDIAV